MGHSGDQTNELIDYLKQFLTVQRWETMNQVLDCRTRHIAVVLEDLYQSQNASAVLRSCDCFGVQDVHVIENRYDFDPSKSVTIGADQWLSLYNYNEMKNREGRSATARCFKHLKRQ
ncbi:MAG: TrmH family RNA methyltransferase, partial [Balneolaceae bacterium]|nr:TrmH family RNA methyltransferase [Balneolaceae bacterium]